MVAVIRAKMPMGKVGFQLDFSRSIALAVSLRSESGY